MFISCSFQSFLAVYVIGATRRCFLLFVCKSSSAYVANCSCFFWFVRLLNSLETQQEKSNKTPLSQATKTFVQDIATQDIFFFGLHVRPAFCRSVGRSITVSQSAIMRAVIFVSEARVVFSKHVYFRNKYIHPSVYTTYLYL